MENLILTGGNYPPNNLYVQCNPYLNPSMHSNRNWQVVPKIYLECKGSEITKKFLKSKDSEGFCVPDFKTDYQGTARVILG